MEVEENLIPGLFLMDVIDRQVEVVLGNGTGCALIHLNIRINGDLGIRSANK
jgi:hypothetical protein